MRDFVRSYETRTGRPLWRTVLGVPAGSEGDRAAIYRLAVLAFGIAVIVIRALG